MQPFLSGETTLALLLITLTLLFFAAAGDEHPYEPYHRNFETKRSSVELDSRPPVQAEELTIKLDALKQQHEQPEVMRRSVRQVPRNSKPSSYLPSRLRPRNLQILAALLSHQSLHTMNMPVLKPDISWSLGGLGLPLVRTIRGRSLRCRGKGSVKYVGGGGSVDEVGYSSQMGNDESGELMSFRSAGGRVIEVGD